MANLEKDTNREISHAIDFCDGLDNKFTGRFHGTPKKKPKVFEEKKNESADGNFVDNMCKGGGPAKVSSRRSPPKKRKTSGQASYEIVSELQSERKPVENDYFWNWTVTIKVSDILIGAAVGLVIGCTAVYIFSQTKN